MVQPALVAASTTAINALTALVSSNGSASATLSGSAALSVVNTLVALTANPAAVSPAAAPAALAGASIVSKKDCTFIPVSVREGLAITRNLGYRCADRQLYPHIVRGAYWGLPWPMPLTGQ